MNRREFLGLTAGATLWPRAGARGAPVGDDKVDASKLPRWRGFNLLEKFTDRRNAPFVESDFEWMAEWGFDFARLPMSYWCWAGADPESWLELEEDSLEHIDQAIEFGRQHGVHVSLNLHRAPGYCVNPPEEPLDLWTNEKALDACAFHWAHFAERYKGIPNPELSFDLLNEPARIDEEIYVRVATRLVEAIREHDPGRLIVADGLAWGREPVHGLAGLGVAQSTRGYEPMRISHHKASWIRGSEDWDEPDWPLRQGDRTLDKEHLRRSCIEPWKELEAKGVGVHVGEWGAFNATPHKAVLAWMRDFLELWQEAGWGWSQWNLRGSFGVLDSNRKDVEYEDFRGHKLDREMLELLRAH